MTNVHTALIFNPFRDEGMMTNYADDGDPDMMSKENESKRSALRDHPAVQDVIERVLALYKKDSVGSISKEEYLTKYMRIVTLLMPRMSAEEARAEGEVD